MRRPVHYLGLLEVSEHIRKGDLRSVEVTQALISRIEALNPRVNGVLQLMGDSALDLARQADSEIASGFWRGPLHGVPIGMKDVVWTKGIPTSSGFASRLGHQFPENATLIDKLHTAGAVLLAKLHLTEGANFDHDPKLPRPVNPWSADHWTGVSSSGSGVSVASGFVFGAVATDSGGSIRMPSSANSVTGIKPSWGRVSRHGIYHSIESLDTVGTIARNVEDAAALLQVISGADPKDSTALCDPVPNYSIGIGDSIGDLTIGIDWSYATEGVSAEVAQAVRDALAVFQRLGARVREVKVPWGLEQALATLNMIVAEIGKSAEDHFPGSTKGASLTGREEAGGIKASDLVRAYQARDRVKGAMNAVLKDVDLIIMPGLGEVLPTWETIAEISQDTDRLLGVLCRYTAAFNIAAVPTISLPGGFTRGGLPIGIQLAAGALREADLVRVGAAFQRVTDHHSRRPPLD